jgi:hypothetical protein
MGREALGQRLADETPLECTATFIGAVAMSGS